SEEHTSELQSRRDLVCRLLLEKKKQPARMTPPEILWNVDASVHLGPSHQLSRPTLRSTPKACVRLCFLLTTSCHRSPFFANRAGTSLIVKSMGSAASSSSQLSGMDTGAPGTPRGEYATFKVLPRTFML